MSITAPTTYPNCDQWIDPAVGVTLASGRVSAVADQSPVGTNGVSQATVETRPAGGTTVPASVQFDIGDTTGVLRRLDAPTGLAIDRQNFTLAFVFDLTTIQNGTFQVLASASGNTLALYVNNDGKFLAFNFGGQVVTTLRPRSGKNVALLVGTAAAFTVYLNGASQAFDALPAGTINTIQYGAWGLLFPYHGNVYRIAKYSSALTGADPASLVSGLMADFGIVSPPEAVVIFGEDSISEGYVATQNRSYIRRIGLSDRVASYNVSVAGQQIAAATTDAASQIDTLFSGVCPTVYSCFIGTNDLALGGRTGTQAYTDLKALLAGRKTANPGLKSVTYTMLARTGLTTERTTFNALLKADFPTAHPTLPYCYLPGAGVTYADLLVDFGAIPGMVFPDGTHPDDASHQLLADVAGPAIRSLAGLSDAPVLSLTGPGGPLADGDTYPAGTVAHNSTALFTIGNPGDADLTGINIAVPAGTTLVAGAPTVVPEGESRDYHIQFSGAGQAVNGLVTISGTGIPNLSFTLIASISQESDVEITINNTVKLNENSGGPGNLNFIREPFAYFGAKIIVVKASTYSNGLFKPLGQATIQKGVWSTEIEVPAGDTYKIIAKSFDGKDVVIKSITV